MAPITRAAAEGNPALKPSGSADALPARSSKRRGVVKVKPKAGIKGTAGKKKTAEANKAAEGGRKRMGRKPTPKSQKEAERSANNDESQEDHSPGGATDDEASRSSIQATVTKNTLEESMINAEYDLQHALQFDLVLGFHQDLLIYSRIVHKELMSREAMHKLKPEDIANWWRDSQLTKELYRYNAKLEEGEKTQSDESGMPEEAKDHRRRFEGTQKQRYEGWFFQIQDVSGSPIQRGENVSHDDLVAGHDRPQFLYSYFRHEPPVIACEVLQRPVTDLKHVYFKRVARPQRQVQFRKDPGELGTVRYDFAQILIENNASVPGIRSRRIAECLREKKKVDNNVDTWSSHGIRLTTPFQTAYRQSYYSQLLQGLNGPPQQKSFFTTTNLCGTGVHITHPGGFDLATLQHLAYILVMYEEQINKLFPPHRRPDINAIARPHHKWAQRILSNKRSFATVQQKPAARMELKWLFNEHDQAWRLQSVARKFKPLSDIRKIIFDPAMTVRRLQDLMNPGEESLPKEHQVPQREKPPDWTTRDYLVSFRWVNGELFQVDDSTNLSFPPTIEFRQFEGEDDLANLKWWVIFCRGLVRLANHRAHSSSDSTVPVQDEYPHSEWSDDILLSDLFDLMNFPPRGRERLHLRAVFQARRHFAMQQKYRPPLEQRNQIGLADQSFVQGYQWKKQNLFGDTYEKWWREGKRVRDNRHPSEEWTGDDNIGKRKRHRGDNGNGDGSNDKGYEKRSPTPGLLRDRQPTEMRWPRAPPPVKHVRTAELIRHIPDRNLPSMYDIDRWLQDEATAEYTLEDHRYADLEFIRVHMADLQKLTSLPADSDDIRRWLFQRLEEPMNDRINIRFPAKPQLSIQQEIDERMAWRNEMEGVGTKFRKCLNDLYNLIVKATNNRQGIEAAARCQTPFTHNDYAKAEGSLRIEDLGRLDYLRPKLTDKMKQEMGMDAPIIIYELGVALVADECQDFARVLIQKVGILPFGIFEHDRYRNFEAYVKFLVEILMNATIYRQDDQLSTDGRVPPETPFTRKEYHKAWTNPPAPDRLRHPPEKFPQVGSPPWSPLPPHSPELLSSQQWANYRWFWQYFVMDHVRLPHPAQAPKETFVPWYERQKKWAYSLPDLSESMRPVSDEKLEHKLVTEALWQIQDITPREAEDLGEICMKILNERILTWGPDRNPARTPLAYYEYARFMKGPTPQFNYDRIPKVPNLQHHGFPIEGNRLAHVVSDTQRISETRRKNSGHRNERGAIPSQTISPKDRRGLPPLGPPIAQRGHRRQRPSNDASIFELQNDASTESNGTSSVAKRRYFPHSRPNYSDVSSISMRREANRNSAAKDTLFSPQSADSPGFVAKERWAKEDDEDDEDELAMDDGWREKAKRGEKKRVSWAEGVKGSGRRYGGSYGGNEEVSYELVRLEADGTERALGEEELRDL